MNEIISQNLEAIRERCRNFGILKLEVFGAAATGQFDPKRSNIDFIVEYPVDYDFGLWLSRFFAFQESLESLLNRPVDLVMADSPAMHNVWFRDEVQKTRTVLYVR